MLSAIARAEDVISSMTFSQYEQHKLAPLAIERLLQIITEASIHLTEKDRALCPGVEWRDMRNLGNRLRHAYHAIDTEQLWNIVRQDLPALKAAVERALREHFQQTPGT